MVEAKSSWIGKLMYLDDGKYVEHARGHSFKNNQYPEALDSIRQIAESHNHFNLPVEDDEWLGC